MIVALLGSSRLAFKLFVHARQAAILILSMQQEYYIQVIVIFIGLVFSRRHDYVTCYIRPRYRIVMQLNVI